MKYCFAIQEIPPSVNGAYGGNVTRYLTPKAKKFKKSVTQAINADSTSYSAGINLANKRLKFEMYVSSSNWFNKDGRIKKNDITNRIKLFEDAVLEALGLDDSHVFAFQVYKIQSSVDLTYCEISNIGASHTFSVPDRLLDELRSLSAQAEVLELSNA